MRIIAGTLGGRMFDSPHGHRTHPMSDKIRGALFNALGDIEDLTVLDAFAGSGALSFEAISRSARSAIAIDNDRSAQMTIAQNIKSLGLGNKVKLIKASANAWLQTNPEAMFDLVLCDPPYDELQMNVLQKLTSRVKPGGVIVFSLPPKANITLPEQFELLTGKSYGDAQLVYFRRVSS